MAFKKTKQEALDLLQEKEKRLAELTEESAYAVQMVQNTIDSGFKIKPAASTVRVI